MHTDTDHNPAACAAHTAHWYATRVTIWREMAARFRP
jgi:hypothetical protein